MIRMPKSNDSDNIFIRKTIMCYIRGGGTQSQFLKISIGKPKTSSDYKVFWYSLKKTSTGICLGMVLIGNSIEDFWVVFFINMII